MQVCCQNNLRQFAPLPPVSECQPLDNPPPLVSAFVWPPPSVSNDTIYFDYLIIWLNSNEFTACFGWNWTWNIKTNKKKEIDKYKKKKKKKKKKIQSLWLFWLFLIFSLFKKVSIHPTSTKDNEKLTKMMRWKVTWE